MCHFNQYNQQFNDSSFKIFGSEVIPIFECGRFWFYKRTPQRKYAHVHTYTSVPSYLNPFGFLPFSISYLLSNVLFIVYMNSIFKIVKFLTHWNVCRAEVYKFTNKTKEDTRKLLELFYLDESIFVRYVYNALREAYYARWILRGRI